LQTHIAIDRQYCPRRPLPSALVVRCRIFFALDVSNLMLLHIASVMATGLSIRFSQVRIQSSQAMEMRCPTAEAEKLDQDFAAMEKLIGFSGSEHLADLRNLPQASFWPHSSFIGELAAADDAASEGRNRTLAGATLGPVEVDPHSLDKKTSRLPIKATHDGRLLTPARPMPDC
jgi:hypothetical protein